MGLGNQGKKVNGFKPSAGGYAHLNAMASAERLKKHLLVASIKDLCMFRSPSAPMLGVLCKPSPLRGA